MSNAARAARATHATLTGPLTLLQAAEVARWYEALAPDLTRWLCARGVMSRRDADDIIQETFVRIIRHAPHVASFTPQQRRNYAFTIAANLITNGIRQWSRRGGNPLGFNAYDELTTSELAITDPASADQEWLAHARPEAQPEQTTAARMTLRAVWDATPEEYRALLVMVAQQYTMAEMADALGITVSAVATRIWRMRQALLTAGERIA